ncbi:MAG: aldo/keto reductase, partial [Candidatus Omnitrophica bacterium]|nr:aldo/keto reductase [Candidatus Omnitrophota bacterium]
YMYGDSEEVIGAFLTSRSGGGQAPNIISKLPKIELAENTGFDGVYAVVKEYVTTSLERLHLRSIPIYMMHSALNLDSHNGNVVKSLIRLRDEGLIEKAGVSVYHPREAERALEFSALEAVQIMLNVLDHRFLAKELLPRLAAEKTVFVRSVFLQGLFFLEDGELPANLKGAAGYLKKLKSLSEEEGKGIDEIAMGFVAGFREVDSMVIGAESAEQVLRNAELLDRAKISDDLRGRIMEVFSGVPEEIVVPYMWNA